MDIWIDKNSYGIQAVLSLKLDLLPATAYIVNEKEHKSLNFSLLVYPDEVIVYIYDIKKLKLNYFYNFLIKRKIRERKKIRDTVKLIRQLILEDKIEALRTLFDNITITY
ncbi:MAG: hypothetical protein DRP27_06330 [Thermotogae bacterium]|nr:MAG: hypothetical protein DRP27_06330 [Thermotogota bacterium]